MKSRKKTTGGSSRANIFTAHEGKPHMKANGKATVSRRFILAKMSAAEDRILALAIKVQQTAKVKRKAVALVS
ncbi:hypothetical protein [Rubripirellula reticaptiva]|uniref:Uncharacterized protein n=1 Tax=Rubripirellula reticaptiva TaxID=2528013 RepID=A0A5C6F266_9BACT|nr:hypothetical protein [Rubripirellula reticaptiva]TWU55332.1 hypothetical protein Poly59_16290 [Rubripirellula reticaptiva]